MALQNYRGLTVWQAAMDLVVHTYVLTKTFPKEELYGLTSQLRRATVSIPLNIAEGYGRKHRGDYVRFLSIARGSLMEVETLMIITGRVQYAERETLQPLWKETQDIGKMLNRLMHVLSAPSSATTENP